MRSFSFKNRLTLGVCAAGTAIASSGFIAGSFLGKLLGGHDATAYACLQNAFHDNALHGTFFRVWSSSMNSGYGDPILAYRPVLYTYASELFYFLTNHIFAAMNLGNILFLALAAAGMYYLSETLLETLFPEDPETREWGIVAAVVGYILSPYVLYDYYVRAAYSEATCFAVLPWLALAFIQLASNPTQRTFAGAALAYFCLAIGHPLIHLISAPFVIAAGFVWRRDIRNRPAWLAAIGLGLIMSSYYWLPAFAGRNYVKSALNSVDFLSYASHPHRLDQIFWISLGTTLEGLRYYPGILFTFGLGAGLWLWARPDWRGKESPLFTKTAGALLAACAIPLYLMHRASATWYELFPLLQMVQLPARFLTLITFFSCLLGVIVACRLLRKPWQWQCLLALLIISGILDIKRAKFSDYPAEDFTSAAIIRHGWGWEPHFGAPVNVQVLPTTPAPALVTVIEGQAALTCARKSPTLAECAVQSAGPATLQFNTFDFPGWAAYVDDLPAAKVGRNPQNGAQQLTIQEAGSHRVRWRFEGTPIQGLSLFVSLLSWLAWLVLLLGPPTRVLEGLAALGRGAAAGADLIFSHPAVLWIQAHSAGLVLTLTSALIGYWFLPQVLHASLPANDEVTHISILRQMAEVWSRGGNILDFWSGHLILGQALMRISHLLFYLFAWLIHQASPSGFSIEQSFYASVLMCVVLLPWSFYQGARWLGFSKLESALAALLFTLTFDSANYGVGLFNYAFGGHGIDNQAFALLFAPLCLGLAHRALRGEGSVLYAALAFSATWMSHLFLGYMATLWIAVDAILVCAARPKERRRIAGAWLGLHLLFFLFSSGFIYTILQDRLLQHRSLEEPAFKFLGLGAGQVLRDLIAGGILDAGAPLPMITIFSAVGFAFGLAALARGPRRLDEFNGAALPIHALVWLALSFGPATWGRALYLLPFSRDLHWHRFIVFAQTAFLFCAAVGLAGTFDFWRSRARGKAEVWGIALCLLGLFIPSLISQQRHFTVVNRNLVLGSQKAWTADTSFHSIVEFALKHPEGRYYAGNDVNYGKQLMVASFPLYLVLTAFDVDTVGFMHNSTAHTTTLYFHGDWRDPWDPRQEELLNIRYLILPNSRPPLPRYAPVLKTELATIYDTGQRDGYFMIGAPGEKGCADSDGLSRSIKPWLLGPLSESRVFPLVELSRNCSGKALLEDVVQRPSSAKASGAVLAAGVSPGINSRRYWAKVRMETPGLLVFKMNYHPAWQATINGRTAETAMVVPAYQGVFVQPGISEVQFEYKPSKIRTRLFALSSALIAALCLAKFLF